MTDLGIECRGGARKPLGLVKDWHHSMAQPNKPAAIPHTTVKAHRPKHGPRHLRGFHLKLSQQGMCTLCFTGLFLRHL